MSLRKIYHEDENTTDSIDETTTMHDGFDTERGGDETMAAAADDEDVVAPRLVMECVKGGKDQDYYTSSSDASSTVSIAAGGGGEQSKQQQQQRRSRKCFGVTTTGTRLVAAVAVMIGMMVIVAAITTACLLNQNANFKKVDTIAPSSSSSSSSSLHSQQVMFVSPHAVASDDDKSFGESIAVDGNLMVVGAPFEHSRRGTVYVYARPSPEAPWEFEVQLMASDGEDEDMFGTTVAVSGNTLLVGAPHEATHGGSAYVFVRTTTKNEDDEVVVVWMEQAKLVASDYKGDEQFGFSVALEGNYAVVGALADSMEEGVRSYGSAYVFVRTANADGSSSPTTATWTQQAELKVDDDAADGYGATVAISAETVLVGTFNGRTDGSANAFVHVLAESGVWMLEATLKAGDDGNNDMGNMAIAGDTIVIGMRSYDTDENGVDSGAAYIYERRAGVWSLQTILAPDEGNIQDGFGDSVAISGNTIAIGADGHDKSGFNSGTVFLFSKTGFTWSEAAQLVANKSALNGSFGYRVDMSGSTVVVSARDNGESGYACYIIDVDN